MSDLPEGIEVEQSKGLVSRSLMFLLGIAVLFPVPLLLSVDWNSIEAQPEKVERVVIQMPHEVRRTDIERAAEELRIQLSTLESYVGRRDDLSVGEQKAMMSRWQREVEDIKARYRIWGVVDAQHPDAVAEDSMRNALLYLHSLRHVALHDPEGRASPEFKRLRGAFQDSISTALGH